VDDRIATGEPGDERGARASDPDRSDQGAEERDVAARARDEAAAARDAASAAAGDTPQAARDRALAAQDRAAAARDREHAAQERRAAAARLENAYRDDVTGVLSRGAGRDQLRQAVARAHRSGEPLTVAFLDVDHLKRINDERGHAYGDRLLQEVGLALRQTLRSYDVLARDGGDEFVCALVDARLPLAERRFRDIAEILTKAIPGSSISVGFAELHDDETLEAVIHRADRDMYERRNTSRKTDN
jgi:diguanylate cyclase (GGDEF)-like protein